ncbi:hypothetical protein OV203_18600 [Nannocystis sp. ILAH1]|uniref:hypothetical protein n=1 Tax=unclassified Nannocystis TaxID=2627009 RepID=UPI00226F3D38|nr:MULTISPECIES: hypothetical protein [unclassified Nannocystis]MCY0989154.1 hypothetical protein [Nannocystis sp. ILAH1]MCY1067912.1 hypothetical protein [Nannocystis sp. RBIL2]
MSRLSLIAALGLCSTSALFVSACKEEAEEPFGFTCVELIQAENQDENPFAGTAKIKVTLKYEPCLIDYYTKTNVDQAMNGKEGEAVFSEWAERLCTEGVADPLVACEVESFAQTLQPSETNPIYQMTVTYRVTDPSKISGRTLLWGPGPVEAYADCATGQRPFVRLTLPSDVIGIDKDNKTLWNAQSWANPRGIMQRNTAGCIQASIARQ